MNAKPAEIHLHANVTIAIMAADTLLRYCSYYKGENECPPEYYGKGEGQLWLAEKFVCDELCELLDAANLHVSFASYVGCYIGKWNPYGLHDVMRLYFDKFPELRGKCVY